MLCVGWVFVCKFIQRTRLWEKNFWVPHNYAVFRCDDDKLDRFSAARSGMFQLINWVILHLRHKWDISINWTAFVLWRRNISPTQWRASGRCDALGMFISLHACVMQSRHWRQAFCLLNRFDNENDGKPREISFFFVSRGSASFSHRLSLRRTSNGASRIYFINLQTPSPQRPGEIESEICFNVARLHHRAAISFRPGI